MGKGTEIIALKDTRRSNKVLDGINVGDKIVLEALG